MITTTTPSIEGRRIIEYKGIVFGEIVSGVDFVKDIAASFSNFFGGRSGSYEEELINARRNAIAEIRKKTCYELIRNENGKGYIFNKENIQNS